MVDHGYCSAAGLEAHHQLLPPWAIFTLFRHPSYNDVRKLTLSNLLMDRKQFRELKLFIVLLFSLVFVLWGAEEGQGER